MTLADLIRSFRRTVQDVREPYLFTNDDITDWLIEAEQEACIRGRLIYECSNEQICRVTLAPGKTTYKLHTAIYEIHYIAYVRDPLPPGVEIDYRDTTAGHPPRHRPITLVSRDWLDHHRRDWREDDEYPEFAIQDDATLTFSPSPRLAYGHIWLEGFRLPIRGLTRDLNSTPEIHPAHHRFLVEWALYQALRLPDADAIDLGRSTEALGRFTQYFGLRPDVDLRRQTRTDDPHHVVATWP